MTTTRERGLAPAVIQPSLASLHLATTRSVAGISASSYLGDVVFANIRALVGERITGTTHTMLPTSVKGITGGSVTSNFTALTALLSPILLGMAGTAGTGSVTFHVEVGFTGSRFVVLQGLVNSRAAYPSIEWVVVNHRSNKIPASGTPRKFNLR